MRSKMIGYLTLLSICLVTLTAADCIAGTNSRVVERGENITFPIKSGKEYDVTLALNGAFIAQLTCLNVNCKLDSKKPGIVYEGGSLTIMNSSSRDMGNYKIRYKGSSLEKDKIEKCFNVTVIDYDNLPSTISPDPPSTTPAVSSVVSRSDPPSTISLDPPSTTPAVSSVVSRSDPPSTISLEHLQIIAVGIPVGITVVIAVGIFVYWMCQKKQQNSSDADVGAGHSGVNNLLQSSVKRKTDDETLELVIQPEPPTQGRLEQDVPQ